MTDNPFTVIANYLGCTPAEVANMTLDEIRAATARARREADQATADLAWLEAAGEVANNPYED